MTLVLQWREPGAPLGLQWRSVPPFVFGWRVPAPPLALQWRVMPAGTTRDATTVATMLAAGLALPPTPALGPRQPLDILATVVGPPGPAGAQGQPGPGSSGFGAIRYVSPAMAQVLTANVPVPVAFVPASVVRNLLAPLVGYDMWDGAYIRARRSGDVFLVKVAVSMVPMLVGGLLDIAIAPTPPVAPYPNDASAAIIGNSGAPQTIAITFPIIAQAAFLANGGSILLTSTVGATITGVALTFYPITAMQ